MLSKKSFGGNKRNFLKLLMRFVRSNVKPRTFVGTTEHRSVGVVQKSPFARFLASFDFRLFRQHQSIASFWQSAGYFRSTSMSRHSQRPTACRSCFHTP